MLTEKDVLELKASLEMKVAEGLVSLKDAHAQLKATITSLNEQVTVLASKIAVSLPGVDQGKKGAEAFSFLRAWAGIKTGKWDKVAPFEHEVFQQAEKALGSATGTAGGYVVPVEFVRVLIEQLYANSAVLSMGATRLNPTSFPLEMPKQTGGATANWADENATIPESEPTVGKISLSPKYLTAYVKMSQRIFDYSDPGMEALTRRDIIRQMDLALDKGILEGDGTNNSPIGILNQPGVQTTAGATDGEVVNYDLLLDMEGKVEDSNALTGEAGFISHPSVFRTLKRQKVAQFSGDTSGLPIYAPIMNNGALKEAIGNFAATTQILANRTKGATTAKISRLYYGVWPEIMVAFWGSLVLKASDAPGFQQNQIHLKAVMEADCAVRHPESFCIATDVIRA